MLRFKKDSMLLVEFALNEMTIDEFRTMNEHDVNMILECLPKGKTRFYYFKDRYAQMLLSYYVGSGLPIRQIKKTRYGKLLNKRFIKAATENAGDGMLTPEAVQSIWPGEYECFLLTLDRWGQGTKWLRRWYQTSRGGYNLVLQLNFSAKHNRPYYQLVGPEDRHPFERLSHPIAGEGYHTLAWSRIDVDLDADQALIEEIQNDWIRDALWAKGYIERLRRYGSRRAWENSYFARCLNGSAEDIIRYVDEILSAYVKLWAEAMLAATLWFLREEIGIRTVFYHTFETGNRLKSIGNWSRPPRSLYTTLPEQFCFEKTSTGPECLQKQRRKRTRAIKPESLKFWKLVF